MLPRALALAAVALLLSLRALAYASPPDPWWIGGLYDDADYDDVIILITSTPGTAETAPVTALQPGRTTVWIVAPADERLVLGPALPQHQPRAPPAS